ncbi:LacI family DNA-binding transcriptional regulator [Paenibacillus sp. FSL R7-0198]|uniref:LacI family DNA-binding transcriptional regulator n=2 Tax=Paenibacillus TaxID=44249 RepID=UPI002854BD5A|nr:LacI family DNA-binding transcriptional regulator [Paenibacillus sp. 2003]MDR6715666.1 LacI family transcriptional regulator [Paenibacillus sp. 2003]
MMKTKVTIQEIAHFTGLSKFAVSRALSGKSGVSDQTRDVILKAAGKLGYFKDNSMLSGELYNNNESQEPKNTRSSGTILILFPNVRYQNQDSVYWGPVFNGISSKLNQKGINILTLTEPSADQLFTLLNPDAIRGIITVGSISTPILLEIKRLSIPVVMVDHLDPVFHSDSIFTDNFASMREIMLYLLRKGFKTFQFVGNIGDAHSFYERWIAYTSVLMGHGMEIHQIPELSNQALDEFRQTFTSVINEDNLPEVFVCANDFYGLYTIEALESMGIRVPDQCVVTGFDNLYDNIPLLATVNVNKELLGARAVDQMLWRIANPESNVEKKLILADVVIREQFGRHSG